MPLTEKGNEILHNMQKEYGTKKGESVFYASKNKGTISGVDSMGSVHDVPIGKCYDQSYPPMDPTSIGGMGPTEPSTAAPSGADADPERLRFASLEARNPVEERRRQREAQEQNQPKEPPPHPVSSDAGGTKSQYMQLAEAAHRMWVEVAKTGNTELANHYHQQSTEYLKKASEAKDQQPGEPGHEAAEMKAVKELEHLHGMDALPKTYTQEQMATMASMFNYNQKGSPY